MNDKDVKPNRNLIVLKIKIF